MLENGESSHFDSSLGGNITIPDEVNILKYASARSKEIAAMTECILNPCRTKLVFQALPVHMRRRVMSHRSARLPRRLRAAAEAQARSSGAEVQGSRKKRRRPHRLLTLLARRTRIHRWLETHIWHAKRFHMTKRWGYNLAEAPCDKAFRACYRAGSNHCLLQDISYCNCIQMSGTIDELTTGFKRITSTNCGLSITANAYLKGQREGSAFIFNVDSYPYECIGKVSFIWRPADNTKIRCIWIFIHPSFYQNVLNILIQCFKLNKIEQMSTDDKKIIDNTKNINNLKHSNDNSNVFDTLEKYGSDNSISLIELRNTLNRFRLTGPLSHAILTQALNPVEIKDDSNLKKKCWFKSYVKQDVNRTAHETQSAFWKKIANITSPAEMQSRLIVALNVVDPRLSLPIKRKKAVPNISETLSASDLINIPENLSTSLLWNINIQKCICDEKITNFELNKLKQNSNLVPGEISNMHSNFQTIPVILIQRPGCGNSNYKKIGYNSGWDIIIPSGYGMAFWLSFVLRGARTGGLRESRSMAFESGNFDIHHDTIARIEDSIEEEKALRRKYFKLPPNKRVNFTKLSINSPFLCRWNTLLNDWKINDNTVEKVFVLRDKNVLKNLQMIISTGKLLPDFDWNMNCLIPIKLINTGKGKLSNNALICIPNADDKLSSSSLQLIEPLKPDKNENKRHKMRLAHKTLLKRLRKRSVRRRRKILEKAKKFVKVPKQDNTKMIEEYTKQMHELWLPSNVDNVRHQCSREVIGYVTTGDYSFSEARSSGVGYIALSTIMKLINKRINNKCFVLTRNILSRQYRYATIEIICDVLGS